jgi:hypothetical protein
MIDGTTEVIPCRQGREGIVVLAEMISNVYEDEESEPTEYDNGTTIWWRYCADTKTLNSHGFVSRADAMDVLGYSENYNLHGFGDYHSGVKTISSEEFHQLLEKFKESRQSEVRALADNHLRQTRQSDAEPVGEGELHRALKDAVAQEPSRVLGEDGLRLVKKEYEFITNDRVDVLLEDQIGRLVVVEVEPACPSGAIIGAAQCMKYRALIAFETGRQVAEVRAILTATSISADVREAANKYNIEPKEVAAT